MCVCVYVLASLSSLSDPHCLSRSGVLLISGPTARGRRKWTDSAPLYSLYRTFQRTAWEDQNGCHPTQDRLHRYLIINPVYYLQTTSRNHATCQSFHFNSKVYKVTEVTPRHSTKKGSSWILNINNITAWVLPFLFLFLCLFSVSSGMQSLLEEMAASPGLVVNLLSGPYVDTLLNCLGQNPDLAAEVTHSAGGGFT